VTKRWAYEVIFVDDDSQTLGNAGHAAGRQATVRMIVRRGEKGCRPPCCAASARREAISWCEDATCRIGRTYSGHAGAAGAQQKDSWSAHATCGRLARPELDLVPLLNSKVATAGAAAGAHSRSMSGYFAFRRADMPEAHLLSPIATKIGLELLVKGDFKNRAKYRFILPTGAWRKQAH